MEAAGPREQVGAVKPESTVYRAGSTPVLVFVGLVTAGIFAAILGAALEGTRVVTLDCDHASSACTLAGKGTPFDLTKLALSSGQDSEVFPAWSAGRGNAERVAQRLRSTMQRAGVELHT